MHERSSLCDLEKLCVQMSIMKCAATHMSPYEEYEEEGALSASKAQHNKAKNAHAGPNAQLNRIKV